MSERGCGKGTEICQKRAQLHGKINNSHISRPIGLIFGYVIGLTVPYLHTKFQPPSSVTFWLEILPVRYTFFSSHNFPGPPRILYAQMIPVLVFPEPNRPKSSHEYELKPLPDIAKNRLP
jgi:hypothetical protein